MKQDIQALLSSKYSKWLVFLGIALFSLLILREYQPLFEAKPVSALVMQRPSSKQEESWTTLLHAPLFGVYQAPLDASHIKKSMLNLTVVGIMLDEKGKASQVIIRLAQGEEMTYFLGDTLPGGGRIKRILAKAILIERDGGLERLSLPENQLIFEPIPKPLKEEE